MAEFNPLEAYHNLDRDDRLKFLLNFGYRLTIVARYFYVPGTEELESPAAVRAVNEIQHQVFAQAIAVIAGDDRRYPDDVFVPIVTDDVPDHGNLRGLVRWAFEEAVHGLGRTVATA
jgi:hypothetical protein